MFCSTCKKYTTKVWFNWNNYSHLTVIVSIKNNNILMLNIACIIKCTVLTSTPRMLLRVVTCFYFIFDGFCVAINMSRTIPVTRKHSILKTKKED